jgi:hypothetical protein
VKTVYLMYETIPLPVISSGGIMPLEDTAKAATASMSREIFLGRGNTGLFNAFHLSRFAANAPPQPSAAPPMGEPSFNGAVWTLIFFTQISILSFYTGTPPPQAVPLPSKEGRLGAFCGEAAGPQLSMLLSTLSLSCSLREGVRQRRRCMRRSRRPATNRKPALRFPEVRVFCRF